MALAKKAVLNVTHYTYGWATGNSSIALAHGQGNMEGVNPGSTWELANADSHRSPARRRPRSRMWASTDLASALTGTAS